MSAFINENFMLSNETARQLFHGEAEKLPIIDYHCHLSPREIAENIRFRDITQLWLVDGHSGDHYKWRAMRANGVPEEYITGDKSSWEKFEKWAATMPYLMRNPLYHWSHLELSRVFGIDKILKPETAREIFEECNAKLATPEYSARNLMRRYHVETVCTTDDPVDSLEWHEKIAADESFEVQVLPAWRPDKAMNLEKTDYLEYLKKLEVVSGVKIDSFASLIEALRIRMDYFAEHGCSVSDHGLEYVMYAPASEEEIEAIFAKRLRGEAVSRADELQFKTAYMVALGREYHKKNWVMQLHYGVKRDNNGMIFGKLGPDAGIDCINNYAPSSEMADYLNALAITDELPKTILYSLNPTDNAAIGTIIGCFQSEEARGKIQQGSAWWFNDNKQGMIEQMTSLANLGLLGNFIGMLTDSRSFLSYTRHEYFRRIMCNLIGGWVENGEYPADEKVLGRMVQDISYNNAVRYFGF